MSRFLSPALSAVTPYTPGEQPQDQQYIKLNTNESPYLPSPRVVAAVSEAEVEKLRLYSDPACAQLLRTAAAHFGLQPSQVMPGNGSDENLFFALRAFCDESHPLAFADITYGCYGVWCGLLHIPTHIIPLKEDFTLDPADYHGLHETIVIANPNAPTGLCLPREAIEACNIIAPEHLEVCVEDPFGVLNEIRNAGSIFLGRNVPEALGDYFAGPNHTLPTSGTARFSSPLGVDDFVKKSSFIYYTREALGEVAPRIADFAEREGLHAHAKSVTIRYEED